MTHEELDRLAELESKATKGPWYPRATDDVNCCNARFVSTEPGPMRDGYWTHDNTTREDFPSSICVTLHQCTPMIGVDNTDNDSDTQLIAALRNAAPALIAAAREAARLREALEMFVAACEAADYPVGVKPRNGPITLNVSREELQRARAALSPTKENPQ